MHELRVGNGLRGGVSLLKASPQGLLKGGVFTVNSPWQRKADFRGGSCTINDTLRWQNSVKEDIRLALQICVAAG